MNVPTLYRRLAEAKDPTEAFLFTFELLESRVTMEEWDIRRHALKWLLVHYPSLMERIVPLIPEYGRWDDLLYLFPCVLDLHSVTSVSGNFSAPGFTSEQLELCRDTQRCVIRFYGNQLVKDREALLGGESPSLAAVYMAREKSRLDKEYGVYLTLSVAMGCLRGQLRQVYLSPLRQATHREVSPRPDRDQVILAELAT